MELIEGQDYCFIYPKDEKDTVQIKFLTGDYKDTIIKYGKVKFEERSGEVHLLFAYDVIESSVMKPKKLEKDETFKNYLGDMLVYLMSSNMDQDIIDEVGTNDTENPYL